MKSARSAGWEMVGWSVLQMAMLIICHFVKQVVGGLEILGIRPLSIAVDLVSVPIWIFLFLSLFYAAWGLRCGYSEQAWNNYAKQVQDDTKKQVILFLSAEKKSLPNWLEKETDIDCGAGKPPSRA